jgi:hypothetical protein
MANDGSTLVGDVGDLAASDDEADAVGFVLFRWHLRPGRALVLAPYIPL